MADGDVSGRAGAWRARRRRTYSVFDHRARPGYIDRDAEIIVGLQTGAPLKRAIMPNGGWRVVETGLRTYGCEVDPRLKEIFTRYRTAPVRGGPADRGQADGQVLAGTRCPPVSTSSATGRNWPGRSGRWANWRRWPPATASTSPGRLAPRRRPGSGSTSATGRQCSGLVVRQSAASRRRSAMCSARTGDFRRRSPWRS